MKDPHTSSFVPGYFYPLATVGLLISLFLFTTNVYAAQLYVETILNDGYNSTGYVGYITHSDGYESQLLHRDSSSSHPLPTGLIYDGYAEVSADYGSLRTYLDVAVNNYQPGTYTVYDDLFMEYQDWAGNAYGYFRDTFTADASTGGYIHFYFNFDGTISTTSTIENLVSPYVSLSAGGRDPTAPPGQGYLGEHYGGAYATTDTSTTVDFKVPFVPGVAKELTFSISSSIIFNDQYLTDAYNAAGTIDFLNTASLSEIMITDLDDNAIPGAVLINESGVAYPISSLNSVPIPATVCLFGSGLLGMIGIARRRKAG